MSGDPIKKSLQVLGYVHFGEVVKYSPSKAMIEHFPHKMVVYLDCAMRDFYDEILKNDEESQISNSKSVFVAPTQVMKESFPEDDFKYIKIAMKDQMLRHYPTAVFDENEYIEVDEIHSFANFDDSIENSLEKAKKLKCQYVIAYYLQAKKIKDDWASNYRITLEEIKYDLKGNPIAMETSSVTTKELTTLEAVLFAQLNLIKN